MNTMKHLHYLLATTLALCAFNASAQLPAKLAEPAQHKLASASGTALKLPEHFKAYASESISTGRRCVVGASTDEDGMNQKPVASARDVAAKRVIWVARLDLPADMYQSRATHCARHRDALFVLLQSDTQSQPSQSQTLLRVARLDAATGTVQLQRDVDVPAAYSAWVDQGSTGFRWSGDRLVVTGKDRPDADRDRQANFTVRLNNDLTP